MTRWTDKQLLAMRQGKFRLDPREADTITQAELARKQAESRIVDACMGYLETDARVKLRYCTTFVGSGWFHPASGAPRRFINVGYPGQPDISGMLEDGRLLGPEVKRPGFKLQPHQEAVKNTICGYYGVAGRVESVDTLRWLIDEATSEARVTDWLRHLAHLYPVAFARVVSEGPR